MVIGYCYIFCYCECYVYWFIVENLIYIDLIYQCQGVGKVLFNYVLKWVEFQGYCQMIVVVGDSVNVVFVVFYICIGFIEIGILKDIGFKYGCWFDMVLL